MPTKLKKSDKPTKQQIIDAILHDDYVTSQSDHSNPGFVSDWLCGLLKDGFAGYKHMKKAELWGIARERELTEE